MPIKGKGKVRLSWGTRSITLENCLFVPDIVINLVSAGELDARGCTIVSKNSKFKVSKGNQTAFSGKILNGLFSIDNPSDTGVSSHLTANVANHKESLMEIHEKLGHPAITRIKPLIGSSFTKSELDTFECKSCALSKITKQPFNLESQRASKPFERIHLDLIGPIKPESSLKHRFALTVVDNHSGYLAAFPLVNKDDTTDILVKLLEMEKAKRGYYPSMICSDGGGEFVGHSRVCEGNAKLSRHSETLLA
ncbi:hypothetical protein VP01_94g8 [Puccinia sorghi]|uniref:Integrase catalytic domain-containing protein n=1 Tax=Puccinia sorghi TaxID=27349 RepID=A0A0L6U6H9_9BASI|nr:hypothetical protein VP01_94g8 [Puccinia sorghi]